MFADLWVKIYSQPGLQRLAIHHPGVKFDMYIDDLQASATGSHRVVTHSLGAAAKEARDWIENGLLGEVSPSIAAVVANSSASAKAVGKNLGPLAGPGGNMAVRILGADFRCGTPVGGGADTTRAKRFQRIRKRRLRFAQLSEGSKPSTNIVFVTGVVLDAIYAAEVIWLSSYRIRVF